MWGASSLFMMPVPWTHWQYNHAVPFPSPLERESSPFLWGFLCKTSETGAVCDVVHWIPLMSKKDIFENKFLCQIKRNPVLKCGHFSCELWTSRSCHFTVFIVRVIAIQQAICDSKRESFVRVGKSLYYA